MGELNVKLEGRNDEAKVLKSSSSPIKSPSQFLNTSQKAEISSTHQKQ